MLFLSLILIFQEPKTLSLQEALQISLANNRDLAAVSLTLSDSQARLEMESDSFSPQYSSQLNASDGETENAGFNFSASKTWRRGTELDIRAEVPLLDTSNDRFKTDYQITLSQPLFQRGSRLYQERGLRAAKRGLANSEASFESSQQNLIFRVIQVWYQIHFQQQSLAFTEKSLDRISGLLEATQIKLKIGKVSQVDLFRVQLLENRTQMERDRSLADLARLRRTLSDLMGQDLAETTALTTPKIPVQKVADQNIDAMITGYEARFEYQRLIREKEEAAAEVTLAKRAMLPDTDLRLSWRLDQVPDVLSFRAENDKGVTISLAQGYQFNRKRRKAEITFANNRLKRLELALTDFKRNHERSILDQLRQLSFEEQRLTLTEQAHEVASQQLEVARMRFERGLINNFDVIEAEEAVLSAANDQERAQRDLILLWLRLRIFLNQLDPEQLDLRGLLVF